MVSSSENDVHQKIRDNGWKQFSILDNQEGVIQGLPIKNNYILVSQDCDIVQRSFEKEKNVEIIHATEVQKPDKSNTNLKNFRTPHIPFKDNGADKYYEMNMGARFFIERTKLADIRPTSGITLIRKLKKPLLN